MRKKNASTLFSFYKETLSRSKMSLTLWSLSFTLMITLGCYTGYLGEQADILRQHLSSLRDLAVRSQEAAFFLQSRREDFAAFEACGFERPLGPEALQTSLGHLPLLHPIKFGAISPLNGIPQNIRCIAQEVSFSIPCLRDRDVFELLDRLVGQGPGIFQIHNVTITRINPLDEEALDKIAAGMPHTLLDAQIVATWIHQ